MIRGFSTTPEAAAAGAAVAETHSAVSWGAILAGAVAALALSIVLTGLAAGFGMKLAFGLASHGSLDAFSPTVGAVMVAIQVLAMGLGGYLAGRLRTKWTGVHGHEVHFRDTAHGLLVWAVATVAGVILAAAVIGPYADRLENQAYAAAAGAQSPQTPAAGPAESAGAAPASPAIDTERAANIAAQSALFMGIGMLLSAFIAAVAAAIGGIRRDEMHGRV